MLDRLFGHFDTLAERYDLEKIKTIGDAYMVAAGVRTPAPTTPQRLRVWRWTWSSRQDPAARSGTWVSTFAWGSTRGR